MQIILLNYKYKIECTNNTNVILTIRWSILVDKAKKLTNVTCIFLKAFIVKSVGIAALPLKIKLYLNKPHQMYHMAKFEIKWNSLLFLPDFFTVFLDIIVFL